MAERRPQSWYEKNAKTTEYFEVEDIPVVVYLDDEDSYWAFNDLGNNYSMGKVVTVGQKKTKKEYDKLVAERAKSLEENRKKAIELGFIEG